MSQADDQPIVRLDAQPNRIAAAAQVLTEAFRDDPAFSVVFPDPDRRMASLLRLWRAVIGYCQAYGRVDTTPDGTGVACWLSPGNTQVTLWGMLRTRLLLPRTILGFAPDARRRFFDISTYLDQGHKQLMSRRHWYLWALGVAPSLQGRGIGGRLLEYSLQQSDLAGMPCYLETQVERNLGFYGRHGFVVVKEGEVPGLGLRLWGMVREPPP